MCAGSDFLAREVQALKQHLPNAATVANAGFGFAACGLAVLDRPELAALAVLAAILMDSLDGALARSLHVESEQGAQLDSLADVISFGVAPALLVGSLLPEGLLAAWLVVVPFPLCAAWRLARFNVSHEGGDEHTAEFVGLPSTGAGGAAATAVLVYLRLTEADVAVSAVLLPFLLALLAALMVSHMPYRHAGAFISRLDPILAIVVGAVLVTGTIVWEYQFLFAGLMWGYVVSAPLLTARELIRAARHA